MLSKINNLSFGKINLKKNNSVQNENNSSLHNVEKTTVIIKQKPSGNIVTREFYPNGTLKTRTMEYPTGDAYIENFDEDGETTSTITRFPSGDKFERVYKK